MAILPMQMGRTKMSRVKKKQQKFCFKTESKTRNTSYIFLILIMSLLLPVSISLQHKLPLMWLAKCESEPNFSLILILLQCVNQWPHWDCSAVLTFGRIRCPSCLLPVHMEKLPGCAWQHANKYPVVLVPMIYHTIPGRGVRSSALCSLMSRIWLFEDSPMNQLYRESWMPLKRNIFGDHGFKI